MLCFAPWSAIWNRFCCSSALYFTIRSRFCFFYVLYFAIWNRICCCSALYFSIRNRFCWSYVIYFATLNRFCCFYSFYFTIWSWLSFFCFFYVATWARFCCFSASYFANAFTNKLNPPSRIAMAGWVELIFEYQLLYHSHTNKNKHNMPPNGPWMHRCLLFYCINRHV